jgi:integrase
MSNQRRRRKGEGSIYQRASDGLWVGAITVGIDEQGKPRRKPVYGKTPQEVQAKMIPVLHDRQRGIPIQTKRLNVETFLQNWLTDAVEPSVRPKTLRTYSDLVKNHLAPGLGRKQLAKLSPQDVQKFLRDKLRSGLAALNVGMTWGLVSRNVATLVRPPRIEKTKRTIFTAEQAGTFLDFVKDHRLSALFRVAFSLGLRRGELLGLRWSDIDLEAGTLEVNQALQRVSSELEIAELKTETSHRAFDLNKAPELLDALRAHRTRQLEERLALGERWRNSGMVFCSTVGTPMEPRNLNRAFDKLVKDAGLPKIRLHDARHSCATFLLSQGVPMRTVMEILGHSQISLTMNTYSQIIPQMTKDAIGLVDSVLARK